MTFLFPHFVRYLSGSEYKFSCYCVKRHCPQKQMTMFSHISVLVIFLFSRFLESQQQANCPADKNEPWSYNSQLPNGPKNWGVTYPTCNGKMQTPINIDTSAVTKDNSLEKMKLFNYNIPVSKAKFLNDGHTVVVTPEDGVSRTITVNGDTYSLIQFHWHWGDNFRIGSEHSVDDQFYSMEFHLVHQNSQGGLAVIGVFYRESLIKLRALDPIVDVLDKVLYKDDSVSVQTSINLDRLVDDGCSFYRYNGSLTTPPCSEGVIWSVCKNTKRIGIRQMREFRKLFSAKKNDKEDLSGCRLSNNVRPIQPLNGRQVVSSK